MKPQVTREQVAGEQDLRKLQVPELMKTVNKRFLNLQVTEE